MAKPILIVRTSGGTSGATNLQVASITNILIERLTDYQVVVLHNVKFDIDFEIIEPNKKK